MTNEKKPSIYTDRGTIGSSDELDEYGVWVKSEPQDLSAAGAEIQDTPDFSAFVDTDDSVSGIEDLPDFDTLEAESSGIISMEDTPEMPEMDTADDSPAFGAEDEPFGFGALAGEIDEGAVDTSDSDAGFTEVSMDDFIGDMTDEPAGLPDISEELPAEEPVPEATEKGASQDLSTQLLMKIVEELSSIRTELSTLKKDFSVIKAASPQGDTGEAGFFGEEDDEKIALTGDELSNILNTADFTEEAGADATADLSDVSSADELSVDNLSAEELSVEEPGGETGLDAIEDLTLDIDLEEIDLDLKSGEEETVSDISRFTDTAAVAEPAEPEEISDISISLDEGIPDFADLESSEEILPDFPEDVSEELLQIRENGAEPMTFAPAPDETDYLTEDTAAASDDLSSDLSTTIADETIDLSEAVIDEPDLSSDIQDNPLEEPSLEEISLDLDLEEAFDDKPADDDIEIPAMEEGFSEEEIELSLDTSDFASLETPEEIEDDFGEELPLSPDVENTGEGGDLSLIPEGFVVEPADTAIDDTLPALEESEEDLEIPAIEEIALPAPAAKDTKDHTTGIPSVLKQELKTVLSYMDQLLESLPDDKIEEFARSEYYDTYKKLFKELGLA